MYKNLRIIFCIIAAALAAVAIFVFVFAGWIWGLMCVLVAAVCAALMVTFKRLQEKQELKDNPPPPKGDFITGPVKKPDEQDKQ